MDLHYFWALQFARQRLTANIIDMVIHIVFTVYAWHRFDGSSFSQWNLLLPLSLFSCLYFFYFKGKEKHRFCLIYLWQQHRLISPHRFLEMERLARQHGFSEVQTQEKLQEILRDLLMFNHGELNRWLAHYLERQQALFRQQDFDRYKKNLRRSLNLNPKE